MKQRQGFSVIAAAAALTLGCAQDAAGPTFRVPPARGALQTSTTGPTFTTIDFPRGFVTLAADINKTGQIVGRYTDAGGIVHGFLLSGTTFTSITVPPSALWTRAIAINDAGDIVGDYSLTDARGDKNVHGFLLQGSTYRSFDFPRAAGTVAEGIDANGDIVGFYTDNVGNNTGTGANDRHGFLLRTGVFIAIDFPGAGSTEAWRVNGNGEVLGRYLSTTDSKWHLYRLSTGSFTTIADFPGAAQTAPDGYSHVGGLNTQGDIASDYCSSTPCQKVDAGVHGFLLSTGTYTTIDPPGAKGSLAFGINEYGDLVGAYVDTNGGIHGYLRTP